MRKKKKRRQDAVWRILKKKPFFQIKYPCFSISWSAYNIGRFIDN